MSWIMSQLMFGMFILIVPVCIVLFLLGKLIKKDPGNALKWGLGLKQLLKK